MPLVGPPGRRGLGLPLRSTGKGAGWCPSRGGGRSRSGRRSGPWRRQHRGSGASGRGAVPAVRGCGDYLSNIDAYTLGKYKLNSREYNMFDLINITHATSGAINDYIESKLGKLDKYFKEDTTANVVIKTRGKIIWQT